MQHQKSLQYHIALQTYVTAGLMVYFSNEKFAT